MSHETLLAEGGADPKIGMVLQDRYRIVRKLGEGGMGAVYEGEHVLIKRRVAIKCLHSHYANSPEIVARFHREALAATSIRHPNIVEVTDMGRFPDGTFFMVLEFLDGRDWAADLSRHGPQSLGQVVHIMTQVCDALAAAHAKGIVHRDLKPENVFLIKHGADSDFAKVLDFGISKMQDSPGDPEAAVRSKGLTRTGMAMGTPYYMAPEQAQGKKDVDHRADIYALGVILFQALTGQYPFDDESYPMLVVKICTQDPPPIARWRPDLPEPVQALVARMLAKKPEERPQSCSEIQAALAPYRAQTQAPVVASDAPSTASLTPGTFGQGAAAAAAAAVASSASSQAQAQAPVIPMTTPAGVASAQVAPAGASTGPIPSAGGRMSTTPFASGDVEARPPLPTSRTPMIVGGGVVAVLLVGIGAFAALAGGGGPTPGAQPVGPDPEATTVPATTEHATTEHATDEAATPEHATARSTEVTPSAPVATVRVQLSTEPEDAEVYLDDHRIPNPFDADLPQTAEPRNLRVQREGYVTQVQDLVLEFPQRVRVRLTRGRGVEDRSTSGARAAAARERGGASTSATRTTEATTEARTGSDTGARTADPPPRDPDPPRVEAPRIEVGAGGASVTTGGSSAESGEGEGGRRTLKNPFGRH